MNDRHLPQQAAMRWLGEYETVIGEYENVTPYHEIVTK